jgi:hypothetical protein
LIDYVALDIRRARKISRTVSTTSNPSAAGNISVKLAFVPNSAANKIQVKDGTYDENNDKVQSKSLPSTYLTITIPGFYQSNNKADASYNLVNPLTSSRDYIGYATSGSAFAPDVTVQYRKAFVRAYGSECFIRRIMETGVDEVIADNANYIDLDVEALANNSFKIDTWFIPTFSRLGYRTPARLNSSDQVMLRNPRTD